MILKVETAAQAAEICGTLNAHALRSVRVVVLSPTYAQAKAVVSWSARDAGVAPVLKIDQCWVDLSHCRVVACPISRFSGPHPDVVIVMQPGRIPAEILDAIVAADGEPHA